MCPRASAVVTLLGLALMCITFVACERPKSASSRAATPPDHTYVVRGRIEELPQPGSPASSLQIRHEPIPDYVRSDGTLGMNSMVMPFPVAPGLSLGGLAVGDAVEFVWEVRKTGDPRSAVTKITRLPPDTPLNFGKVGG
jgi:hypothetical protein